ncbi:C-C motif chemokine 20-like [Puntigrus tetrazona]|uniref:C-C motif chemokine 20-like n=1 Tax=Puntigrus tetrazona TaxID=1606681 RepID=UPI001C8A33C5|nr:C-C motif chemokine 20-like [Puntigrus tetrazona]
MRCASVSLLLCLALMLLAQFSCPISGLRNCPCLKTSKHVLRKEDIDSYIIQEAGVCHITAVLFKTVKGRFICSDPQKPWVKRAIEKETAAEMTTRPVISASASTLKNTSHWNTAG